MLDLIGVLRTCYWECALHKEWIGISLVEHFTCDVKSTVQSFPLNWLAADISVQAPSVFPPVRGLQDILVSSVSDSHKEAGCICFVHTIKCWLVKSLEPTVWVWLGVYKKHRLKLDGGSAFRSLITAVWERTDWSRSLRDHVAIQSGCQVLL